MTPTTSFAFYLHGISFFPHVFIIILLLSSLDFPGGSDGKASAYNAGDPGSILALGRSPREGNGNPLQYSCLENPMDREAWLATVYGLQRVGHDWATSLSIAISGSEWVSWKCMSLGNALPILPFSFTQWLTSTYMWNVTESAGLLPSRPSLSLCCVSLGYPQLLYFHARCFSSAPFWFLPNFFACEYF